MDLFQENNTTMGTDTLGEEIVRRLFQGEKVVVPNLGYLEQKALGSRKTILFKPLKPQDPLMKELSAKDEVFLSQLYKGISALLVEGKQVTLPALGIFHPLKNEDDSLRVSFAPSAILRRQLSGEPEPESIRPAEVVQPAAVVPPADGEESVKVEETAKVGEVVEVVKKEDKPEKPVEPAAKIEPFFKFPAVTIGGQPSYITKKNETNERLDIKQKLLLVYEELLTNQKWQIRAAVGIAVVILLIVVICFASGNKAVTQNKGSESTVVSLPDLAERTYGNAIFWVYIYEANKDKLRSPINIPAGIDLVLPDLATYRVDVNDSLEIRKAQALANTILEQ